MALKAQVRDQGGKALAPLVSLGNLNPLLQDVDPGRFPILGHIDPYGDTILNALQVRSLVKELQVCSANSLAGEEGVIRLLECCSLSLADTHRFLWIFGE